MSNALRADLATCWMDVANSGGAVGFPFLPVSRDAVVEAVDELAADLERGHVVLVQARRDGALAN